MKFNINHNVKVRLTPHGIEVLVLHYERFRKDFPDYYEHNSFKMPPIDSQGYTEYQLWELMRIFGGNMGLGGKIPFETEIEIVEQEKPSVYNSIDADKELLPCPFCGSSAMIFEKDENFAVVCQQPEAECNARILYSQTREEAIQSWNKRWVK